MYTKETKSSFDLEREEPGSRLERYVAQLESIAAWNLDSEEDLTRLQNELVDPRYAARGFRREGECEVYVGETIGFGHEKIHHIGARSASVRRLMAGWAAMRSVEGLGGL